MHRVTKNATCRTLLLGLGLGLGFGLGACQDKTSAPAAKIVTPPSKAVIAAMLDYCKIGELPADKQREAFKLWGWHFGGDKEVGPLWHLAVVKKDPGALATIRAAAAAAVGSAPCTALEALK